MSLLSKELKETKTVWIEFKRIGPNIAMGCKRIRIKTPTRDGIFLVKNQTIFLGYFLCEFKQSPKQLPSSPNLAKVTKAGLYERVFHKEIIKSEKEGWIIIPQTMNISTDPDIPSYGIITFKRELKTLASLVGNR